MAVNLFPILISEIVIISILAFLISKINKDDNGTPNSSNNQTRFNYNTNTIERQIDTFITNLAKKGLNNKLSEDEVKAIFLRELALLNSDPNTKKILLDFLTQYYQPNINNKLLQLENQIKEHELKEHAIIKELQLLKTKLNEENNADELGSNADALGINLAELENPEEENNTSGVTASRAAASGAPLPAATASGTPLPAATASGAPLPAATASGVTASRAAASGTPLPAATASGAPLPAATASGTPLPAATASGAPLPAATASGAPLPAAVNPPPAPLTSAASEASQVAEKVEEAVRGLEHEHSRTNENIKTLHSMQGGTNEENPLIEKSLQLQQSRLQNIEDLTRTVKAIPAPPQSTVIKLSDKDSEPSIPPSQINITVLKTANEEKDKETISKLFNYLIIELNKGLKPDKQFPSFQISDITTENNQIKFDNFINKLNNYVLINLDNIESLINKDDLNFKPIYPFVLLSKNNQTNNEKLTTIFNNISKYYTPIAILQKRQSEYTFLNRTNIETFYINADSKTLNYDKIRSDLLNNTGNNENIIIIFTIKFDIIELIPIPTNSLSNSRKGEIPNLTLRDNKITIKEDSPPTYINYNNQIYLIKPKNTKKKTEDSIFRANLLSTFQKDKLTGTLAGGSTQNENHSIINHNLMKGGKINLETKITSLTEFVKTNYYKDEKDDKLMDFYSESINYPSKNKDKIDLINKTNLLNELFSNSIFLLILIKIIRIILYNKFIGKYSLNKILIIDLLISFICLIIFYSIVDNEIIEYILADIFTSFVLIVLFNIINEKYNLLKSNILKNNLQKQIIITLILLIPYNYII